MGIGSGRGNRRGVRSDPSMNGLIPKTPKTNKLPSQPQSVPSLESARQNARGNGEGKLFLGRQRKKPTMFPAHSMHVPFKRVCPSLGRALKTFRPMAIDPCQPRPEALSHQTKAAPKLWVPIALFLLQQQKHPRTLTG